MYRSHYNYLEKNLPTFFGKVGINWEMNSGIISAHDDKAYSYRRGWEEAGLHFYGVAIYLLTYCRPYDRECRDTPDGWVNPFVWVLSNKEKFLPHLPPVI